MSELDGRKHQPPTATQAVLLLAKYWSKAENVSTNVWVLHHCVSRSLTCRGRPAWCRCEAERWWAGWWVWYRSPDLLLVWAAFPFPSPSLPVAMTTEAAADCQKTACGLCTPPPRECCPWKTVPQAAPYFPDRQEIMNDYLWYGTVSKTITRGIRKDDFIRHLFSVLS